MIEDDFDYTSWEDELEDFNKEAKAEDNKFRKLREKQSPELRKLIRERELLERRLAQLTSHADGHGEQREGDARFQAMYPIQTHTVESRIEERRLKRRDERKKFQEKRLLEADHVKKIKEKQEKLKQDFLKRESMRRNRIKNKYEQALAEKREQIAALRRKIQAAEKKNYEKWEERQALFKRLKGREDKLKRLVQQKRLRSLEDMKQRLLKKKRLKDSELGKSYSKVKDKFQNYKNRGKEYKSLAREAKSIISKPSKGGLERQLIQQLDRKLASTSEISPSEAEAIKQNIANDPMVGEISKYYDMAEKANQVQALMGKAKALADKRKKSNEEARLDNRRRLSAQSLKEKNDAEKSQEMWDRRREAQKGAILAEKKREKRLEERREARRRERQGG
ncbi:hypothetical protein [Marinibactrum halimedae]|uniref:Uncharacterized protein n=1 Tax=Marinibactrum halimedae TaxID=1444977 RepID=A0AA37T385_9GAMM|nr:hypothetical protein [Marinibactrum halimedae]MCD9460275.1 hypothetical protein [Marinibactrum halimedae]GLS24362.1 hypothetical protein GCM10007877_00730 [Marinibactrum halimedae]